MAHLSYEDYENAYYDRETDEWHFVDTIDKTIERELSLPAIVAISYDLESKYYEMSFENINNEKSIDLNYDRLGQSEMYE